MTVDDAKTYIKEMERNRRKNEKYNRRAYADARELSALISLAEYGNANVARQAMKAIKNI